MSLHAFKQRVCQGPTTRTSMFTDSVEHNVWSRNRTDELRRRGHGQSKVVTRGREQIGLVEICGRSHHARNKCNINESYAERCRSDRLGPIPLEIGAILPGIHATLTDVGPGEAD